VRLIDDDLPDLGGSLCPRSYSASRHCPLRRNLGIGPFAERVTALAPMPVHRRSLVAH